MRSLCVKGDTYRIISSRVEKVRRLRESHRADESLSDVGDAARSIAKLLMKIVEHIRYT